MDSLDLERDTDLARTIARRFAAIYAFVREDDLAQEGVLKARSLREAYDPTKGNLDAFLNRGITNAYYDIVRKELRRLQHVRPFDEQKHRNIPCPSAPDPLGALLTHEHVRRLHSVVPTLPPRQRAVVELMLQNTGDDDIMRVTGMTRDAIYSARSHAFTRLRRLLANDPVPA